MDGTLYIGPVWQDSDGNRNVPYLDTDDRKRKLNLNWFENDWNENCRFLAFRKSFHSPVFAGVFYSEVVLFKLFSQPPSILPISKRFSEMAISFLLSRIFISQDICRKNFRRSNLAIDVLR